MPRRRNNAQEVEFVLQDSSRDILCYPHLNKTYFEMTEKLSITLECAICLDKICCKHCCQVLRCSHVFHIGCIYSMNDLFCPVCKDSV